MDGQLVELKNGETFNGHLIGCDNFMNIFLKEVYQTSAVSSHISTFKLLLLGVLVSLFGRLGRRGDESEDGSTNGIRTVADSLNGWLIIFGLMCMCICDAFLCLLSF